MIRAIILFVSIFIISCSHKTTKSKINEDDENLLSKNNENSTFLAKTHYDKFKKNSNYADLLKAADLYRNSGNSEKAIEFYKTLIEKDIYLVNSYEGLIISYTEIGELKRAKDMINEILKIDATRWRPINAFALALSLNAQYSQAINYYNLALLIERNSSVLNNKALTMAFNGNIKDSVDLMEEANNMLSINHPNKQKIVMNLALIYGLNKYNDRAKNILIPYLNEGQIYNNLAIYSILANDHEMAKKHLFKALDYDNHYSKADHNLEIINN